MEGGVGWQGLLLELLEFVGVFAYTHVHALVWCPSFSGNKEQQFYCLLPVIGHFSPSSSLKAAETFQRLSIDM